MPTRRSEVPLPEGLGQPGIRFFMDHNVPDAVGRMLRAAGHEVVLLRERLAPDSPDPLVAAYAELNGAVLVSFDSDFNMLAPRMSVGKRRFGRLSRIALKCYEPEAARRMHAALSLIEHEWSNMLKTNSRRMIVEVGETYIRTIR